MADIRAALAPGPVLRWAGVEVSVRGRGDLFGQQCPRTFHRQSPRALTMNPQTGMWTCYACIGDDGKPLGGDLLRFIAEREGLTTAGEDFVKVKAIAAEIAGVTSEPLPPAERERRRREHREAAERRRREQAEERRRRRAESITKATVYWNALAQRHEPGERELAARGVLGALRLGVVRFDLADHGSIAMPLFTADGQIANVIRRRLPAFAPTKDDRFRPLPGLWGMGTYVNPIADIDDRAVVLAEGFFDSITAALAWPTARAIGARSASDLPMIARHVAAHVAQRRGARMLLVPHRDDAGLAAASAACAAAQDAGLRLRAGTLCIVKHGTADLNDLNDAWRAGWRPSRSTT